MTQIVFHDCDAPECTETIRADDPAFSEWFVGMTLVGQPHSGVDDPFGMPRPPWDDDDDEDENETEHHCIGFRLEIDACSLEHLRLGINAKFLAAVLKINEARA